MTRLKAGLIGCGPRGNAHAAAVRAAGVFDLTTVCDLLPERAAAAARSWEAVAVDDYRRVLEDAAVDVVINATGVDAHLAIVSDTLAAGKHLITEKPFGTDVEAARALVTVAEAATTVNYISFQLRFSPRMAALRRAMRTIDPVQILFGRSRGMMKAQFLNPSPFCGIMDFCAHDFDIVSWFMGRQPEAVTAVVRRNTFTRDTGAADALTAVIDYGDGRAATVIAGIGAPEVGTKCDVSGACGNIVMDGRGELRGVRFDRFDSAGRREALDLTATGPADPDVGLQQAMQGEILSGKAADAPRFRDGLNSLLLTLACLQSAEEHRRVELGSRL